MISPSSLLVCPMMSSLPWRCRVICGGLLGGFSLPRACLGRLRFDLSRLVSRAPFARVGGREAWASGAARRACIVPGSAAVGCLLREGDVLILWITFYRLIGAGVIGYIVFRALSMVRRSFSLVFSAVA